MTVQKMAIGNGAELVHDVKTDYHGQRLATASSDTTVKVIALSNNSTLKPWLRCWATKARFCRLPGPTPKVWLDSYFVFLRLRGQGDDLEGGQSE